MKLTRRAVLRLTGTAAAALALSGCANTIRGVGKDVKETGRAVKSL